MRGITKFLLGVSILFLGISYVFFAVDDFPFSICQTHKQGDNFIVTADCLLDAKLPKMSMQTVVDTIWNDVIGFNEVYNTRSADATYQGTQPVFAKDYPPLVPTSDAEIAALKQADKQNKGILITPKQLAHYYLKYFNFYVADKDISKLKPCTKQNYSLALQHIDKTTLAPGAVFNFNKLLKTITGYCDGLGEDSLLFYGGVCGVSSQLFRISLIHPEIKILQRTPHNERFTVYYGTKVQGDDAAVIEMRKQFEIKNSSSSLVYIRKKTMGDTTYLAFISPKKETKLVKISKVWFDDLSVELTRQIFQPTWTPNTAAITRMLDDKNLIFEETFLSEYINKNYESR